jgi:hypothetical protein
MDWEYRVFEFAVFEFARVGSMLIRGEYRFMKLIK